MIKNISLLLSLIVIILSVFGVHSLHFRFMDIFIHANIFHCLANVWALLYVCFLLRTNSFELLISALIGALMLYVDWPFRIIGFSGCLYALYAVISYRMKNKLRYHLFMAGFILLSIIIPQFAGTYHLACYMAGLLVGYPLNIAQNYVRRRTHITGKRTPTC